jgi:hypothetical protein
LAWSASASSTSFSPGGRCRSHTSDMSLMLTACNPRSIWVNRSSRLALPRLATKADRAAHPCKVWPTQYLIRDRLQAPRLNRNDRQAGVKRLHLATSPCKRAARPAHSDTGGHSYPPAPYGAAAGTLAALLGLVAWLSYPPPLLKRLVNILNRPNHRVKLAKLG